MKKLTWSALVLALALGVAAGGCGGEETEPEGSAPPPTETGGGRIDAEGAWLELLAGRNLTPARDAVEVVVTGGAPALTVTITVPAGAPGTVTFADALFGAEAFTLAEDGWVRVDTAEVRAEIAPLLEPGQSATIELPVEESGSYRVLVPVAGTAAWGDLP